MQLLDRAVMVLVLFLTDYECLDCLTVFILKVGYVALHLID